MGIYQSLRFKPHLKKISVNLQSVNGEQLKVHGQVKLELILNGVKLEHNFYVVSNMNRNLILGQDWLMKNGVRLYYDLGCLRVKDTYVPLVEVCHIASIVRIKSKVVLKPHTAYICKGMVKNNPHVPESSTYQVSAIEQSFINNEPGLQVSNSVIKLNRSRCFPVHITNNTGRTYRLRKGCVIGKVELVNEENIRNIASVSQEKRSCYTREELMEELNCPEEHKDLIRNLLEENSDILAKKRF